MTESANNPRWRPGGHSSKNVCASSLSASTCDSLSTCVLSDSWRQHAMSSVPCHRTVALLQALLVTCVIVEKLYASRDRPRDLQRQRLRDQTRTCLVHVQENSSLHRLHVSSSSKDSSGSAKVSLLRCTGCRASCTVAAAVTLLCF